MSSAPRRGRYAFATSGKRQLSDKAAFVTHGSTPDRFSLQRWVESGNFEFKSPIVVCTEPSPYASEHANDKAFRKAKFMEEARKRFILFLSKGD